MWQEDVAQLEKADAAGGEDFHQEAPAGDSAYCIHNFDQRAPIVEFAHKALPQPLCLEQYGATSSAFVQCTSSVCWPTAPLMAKYLCEHPDLIAGRCVLELGAGPGLVGAVAAALGACRMVLTDSEGTLPLLRQNKDRLQQQGIFVDVAHVEWGRSEDHEAVLQSQLNGFDVILGSDVILAGFDSQKLYESCSALLSRAPGAQLIIGFEFREDWETIGTFIGWAEAAGFDVSFETLGGNNVSEEEDDNECDFTVYTFTRRP